MICINVILKKSQRVFVLILINHLFWVINMSDRRLVIRDGVRLF